MASAALSLEDEIQRISELDQGRAQFQQWRSLGHEALRQLVVCLGPRTDTHCVRWNRSLDITDKALLVKALCRPGSDTSFYTQPLYELQHQQLTSILGEPEQSPLFSSGSKQAIFLDAAFAFDALASGPEAVLGPGTMHYCYVVLRELYYPTAPNWTVGGARAGVGGKPSAFTTSQFVRSIFSFARMLERTGHYLDALAEMQQTGHTGVEAWNVRDARRRALSLHTTLAKRAWNLAFPLKNLVPASFEDDALRAFDSSVQHALLVGLQSLADAFTNACTTVQEYREREEKAADTAERKLRVQWSEGAHGIALDALQDAARRATEARRSFPEVPPDPSRPISASERKQFAERLRAISRQFTETSVGTRSLAKPALDYLWGVLDRELIAASAVGDAVSFEASEMASAAATLGAAGHWADERLMRAAQLLGNAITPSGFAIARPFHAGGGAYYQPVQPHILGAYAQIVEHVQADLSPTVLQRMAQYFATTRREIDATRSSWRWAHSWNDHDLHSPYHTALSTIALDRICRMLDRRINELVLNHFTWRQMPSTALRLQELFYPDYGLAAMSPESSGTPRIAIAEALERMRAHVSDVKLAKQFGPRLYSAVFHGPPGTGKTTLLEALAASADVPLVEVTPSDIIVAGADRIEARARAVLRALSFLTKAVILFDEFDPVLKTRETGGTPQSIFNFLTSGMLPKLKTLYEAAKDRAVAFALVTNILSDLDPAAIRRGRFDATIGVYAPDALSRYGRLFTEVNAYLEQRSCIAPRTLNERFRAVIRATAAISMQDAGRRNWFTRPKPDDPPDADTIFGYLFSEADNPRLPSLSTEGQRPEKKKRKKAQEHEVGKPQRSFWSPTEKQEWERIESLEKRGGLLGDAIWEGVENAFLGLSSASSGEQTATA
ncbi:MAG: AAA family ATPase [Acidobacteria bacterium]|nr:AAA family ATPase [Acidobacteriota bacterium]MBV9478873.1 AAA family ATPase [Acidobacteriota bacterium]